MQAELLRQSQETSRETELGYQNKYDHQAFAPASQKTNENNNQLFDLSDENHELSGGNADGEEHESRSALGLSVPPTFDEGSSMLTGSGVVPRAAEVYSFP